MRAVSVFTIVIASTSSVIALNAQPAGAAGACPGNGQTFTWKNYVDVNWAGCDLKKDTFYLDTFSGGSNLSGANLSNANFEYGVSQIHRSITPT
jgi:hypothetical protein